jgi:hypothetical protein
MLTTSIEKDLRRLLKRLARVDALEKEEPRSFAALRMFLMIPIFLPATAVLIGVGIRNPENVNLVLSVTVLGLATAAWGGLSFVVLPRAFAGSRRRRRAKVAVMVDRFCSVHADFLESVAGNRQRLSEPGQIREMLKLSVVKCADRAVFPPICVITGRKADALQEIPRYLVGVWGIRIFYSVMFFWRFEYCPLKLPFSQDGLLLYRQRMPWSTRLFNAVMRALYSIPVPIVPGFLCLLWCLVGSAIRVLLWPLDRLLGKRCLCFVPWVPYSLGHRDKALDMTFFWCYSRAFADIVNEQVAPITAQTQRMQCLSCAATIPSTRSRCDNCGALVSRSKVCPYCSCQNVKWGVGRPQNGKETLACVLLLMCFVIGSLVYLLALKVRPYCPDCKRRIKAAHTL